jgi:uncharacterized phage protein gp47/JayE
VAFVARTRDQIRSALLAALTSRFSSIGKTLSVEVGSHSYFLADALAVELMQTEAAAQALTHEILPDEAVELLDRHATVHGLERRAAVPAELSVEVTGTPSSTISITLPARLASPSGAVFSCQDASVTINGGGVGSITVLADEPGTAGSLAVGTVLTWQSAPAGLDPTGSVTEVTTSGEDIESDDALRARILSRIQQRPGSGNVEDWIDWCQQVDGIDEVYVYPLLQPGTLTGDTLGCVSVVVMGPPQGSSATNTRQVSNDKLVEIKAFINGTADEQGNTIADGTQLRPACIADADFEIYRLSLTNVQVELEITNTSRYPFAFTGTLTADGASTAVSLIVNGDHTNKVGKSVLVRVGSAARGEWQATELKSGTYDGVSKTTFLVSLSGPPTGLTVYPAPSNWAALQTAFFDYFDSLGPKDTATPRRWPTEDAQGRATVHVARIASTALGVAGVVNVTVNDPPGDTEPTDVRGLCVLETFLVVEA